MKNQAKAFIAFNKFANARVKLIEELRAAGYKTAEEAREVCILWVSHKTGVPAIEKSSGLLKLDSSHAKYQGARTALRDLMHMIGVYSGRSEGCPLTWFFNGS